MTRARETTAMGGALLALLLVAVATWDILLTRPLWLDEVHTLIVAARPSAGLVISDLTGGVDTAPGLLHLVLWAIGKAVSLSPMVLHAFALLAVWLGHIWVFATLRRRFHLVPSLAGTLAVLTQLLVIQMTYEARFYGPWLMLAAAFAWAAGLERTRRRDIWIALLSILLCTIHWFGVVSLAIMCAAVVAAHWRDWRSGVRVVTPAAAGVVVLLFCTPILLGQRAAVTAPTWIPAPNGDQIWVMARTFYVALVPVLALLIILASKLRPAGAAETVTTAPAAGADSGRSGVAALASLALMPLAIGVISYVLQPTLLDRYASVAALAWAPLVAYAAQTLHSRARVLICGLLLLLGVLNYRRAVGGMQAFRRVLDADVRSFDLAVRRTNLPVVFQSRHVQFPIVAERAVGKERMVYLSLSDSTMDAMFPANSHLRLMPAFFRFEREAALLHERVYDFPRIRTQAELDTTSRFLLLASDVSLPAGYKNVERFAEAVFRHHTVTRLETNLALLERR